VLNQIRASQLLKAESELIQSSVDLTMNDRVLLVEMECVHGEVGQYLKNKE